MVENRRVSGGKTIQRQVLYLGEMGGSEQAQWNRALEAFDEGSGRMTQIALFPEGQAPEVPGEAVQVRLKEFELHRPRQWRIGVNLCLPVGIESNSSKSWGTNRF